MMFLIRGGRLVDVMDNPAKENWLLHQTLEFSYEYIELVMTQMPIPSRNISNQITFMNESLVWVQDNQSDSSLSWFAGSKGDQGHVTSLISYSLQHSYHDIIKILHLTIPFKVHRIPPGCHKVHHLPGAIFTIPPSHKIKEKSILSMTTAKTQINIF